MGYEIHIHRADEWSAAGERPIQLSEWTAFVDADDEFRMDNFAEATSPAGERIRLDQDGLAVWLAHPSADAVWFAWFAGKIDVNNPDGAVFRKAAEIATAFGGCVQGDDGEYYSADGSYRSARDEPASSEPAAAPVKRGGRFRRRR